MIELVTPNFVQRPIGPGDDLTPLQNWLADPILMAPLNLPPRRLSLDNLARYVAGFDNRNRFLIGIHLRATGALIGYRLLEVNLAHKRASLHILIADEAHRSHRTTYETQVPFYDWVFGTLGIHKLVAEIVAGNERTIRHSEESGFVFEARLRDELLAADGTHFLDLVRMALFSSVWPTVRAARLAKLTAEKSSVAKL